MPIETTTITSAAYVYTADPYTFVYSDTISAQFPGVPVSRLAESNTAEWKQQQLREPQLVQTCTHLVNNVQYVLVTCPRCLGTGIYHDIRIDAAGQVPQVFDEDKLIQDLEKIILTKLGENAFHQQYGMPQDVDVKTQARLIFIRDRILENLANMQQYQWLASKQDPLNTSPKELINTIDSVDIVEDPTDPSKVHYKIYVRTTSSINPVLIQGQIDIS